MSHTQRGSPSRLPDPRRVPHPRLSSRQAHVLPYLACDWDPLSPLSLLSFYLSPLPSSRHATPARQRRYPWADTGDARASLHLRSTLRALLSHRLERCLPVSAGYPPTPLRISLSPRAVARWKDHDCPCLSLSLSRSRPLRSSLHFSLSPSRSCATRRGFERTSSVHTGNACYCPSSCRYVRERHAGGFAA